MREKIICRFETQADLEEFNKLNGTAFTNMTKEYNYNTKAVKNFRPKVSKIKGLKVEPKYWETQWRGMPEYISEDIDPYACITFNGFDAENDLENAKKFFHQSITDKTQSVWYPKLIPGSHSKYRCVGGTKNGSYPIYVVSKGRHDKCYTSRFLTQMEVEHYVVCEPQEFDLYVKNTGNKYAKILQLDMSYKDNYDTFDDLGDTKGKGPGAARNFAWEHSMGNGFEWHWVMDDNANEGFHFINQNLKQKCRTGAIFHAAEEFVNRYSNIAIAGYNYTMFCPMDKALPAFVMNTRIYSFLLIRNDIPYRWRGRYNEDTDLSLRALKDGWCTVQFNMFTAGKATTQKIKGGNTEEFYSKEGTLPKSQMLKDMHPDVTEVVFKFHRWHHQVDYSGYKQKLIPKPGVVIEDLPLVDNFGLQTIMTEEDNTFDTRSLLEEKYSHLIKK